MESSALLTRIICAVDDASPVYDATKEDPAAVGFLQSERKLAPHGTK